MKAGRPAALVCLALMLAGCVTRQAPAPVAEPRWSKPKPSRVAAAAKTPTPPVVTRAQGDFYTVRRGDTLYSIALEHGADYREMAQWNGLDDPTLILAGQQLRVTPPPTPARSADRLEARPLEPSKTVSHATPARQETAAGRFVWPVKGKVLAEFAEPRRKGIDIDGKPGDPVVAAEAGRVTYTGSGIPGMGKLVVIKHGNGYITVYAHNRDILVREQQEVARGERIAELGSTDSDRPKLHFQIRKGAAAVDPLRYLPGS